MQSNKKETLFRVIVIILIIIIILLLFFSRYGKINDYPIPTGNVDVFDIDINCNCKKNGVSANNELETDVAGITTSVIVNGERQTINVPTYDENKDSKTLGTVFVDDKNGNYIYQQNLSIFNNAAYQYTNKIAPGVYNTYHFVVHNSSNSNLKYNIEMYEETEYSINLKYRLRRQESYVLGNEETWVTAAELKTAFKNISYSSSDSYSLDWKWFDDNNVEDTIAGKNMTDVYKLNIRFNFEAVEG